MGLVFVDCDDPTEDPVQTCELRVVAGLQKPPFVMVAVYAEDDAGTHPSEFRFWGCMCMFFKNNF